MKQPMSRRSDALCEPPVSRFLRVLRHELRSSVAPDLTSDRGRSVVDLMQLLLDHLIVREEQLEPVIAPLVKAQAEALRTFNVVLDRASDRTGADTEPQNDSAIEQHALLAVNLERDIAKLMSRLHALPDRERALAWESIKNVAAAERDFHTAVEQQEHALASAETAAAAGQAGIEPRRLQDYLNERAPGDSAIEVGDIATPLGGYSKDTFIVSLRGPGRPADEIVIRCDMPNGPLEGSVTSEFDVIQAMHAAGVPVAQPLWVEPDVTVLGHPFIVVKRVPGKQLMDVKLDVTGDGATECVRQLARVLARVHSVDPQQVTSAQAAQSTHAHILRLLDQFEQQWQRRRMGPSPVIAAGLAWMRHHIPSDLPAARIVHGDATLRNLLFADGRVTAMLDWETWHLGDPAEDLAYSRSDVERFLPWEEFVAEYHANGGVALTPERERYWGMWIYLRGAITSVSMMDRLLLEPAPDIRPAFGGPHFTRYCIRKVADYLQTL